MSWVHWKVPVDLVEEDVGTPYNERKGAGLCEGYLFCFRRMGLGKPPTVRQVAKHCGWGKRKASEILDRAIAEWRADCTRSNYPGWDGVLRGKQAALRARAGHSGDEPGLSPEDTPAPLTSTSTHSDEDTPGTERGHSGDTPAGAPLQKREPSGEVPPPEPPPPPRLEGLTRPQREALRAAGYTSTAKLAQARRSEAKALPGIGRKALVVLDRLVEAHGGWQPEPEKDTLASTLCQQASDAFLAAWRRRHPEVEYPWRFKGRNNDRGHQKTLVAIARLHLDHPDRTDRLEAAADLYLEEQAAGRAWPHDGEPATFGTFTKVADRYLLKVQGVRPRDGPPTGSPVGGLTAGARAQNANLSLLARLHNEALDEEAALKEAQNA